MHHTLPFPHWQKYTVHTNKSTLDKLTAFINAQEDEVYSPIFKKHNRLIGDPDYDWESEPDPFRMQYVVPHYISELAFKDIDQSIVNVIRPFLPSFKPRHHSILWSLPGGGDQSKHYDFHKTTFPRFAGILSLDDSTKLGIRNAENEWITVNIPRGEMLIFRGDVMHHGSKYESTNKRLYFKLLPDGAELEQVEKDSVSHRFVCPKCGQGMEPQSEQNHSRYHCGKSAEEILRQNEKNKVKSAKRRAVLKAEKAKKVKSG